MKKKHAESVVAQYDRSTVPARGAGTSRLAASGPPADPSAWTCRSLLSLNTPARKGQRWPICYRRTWRPSWEKVQNERRVIDAVGGCDPSETSMMKQQLYLQLHADILFVFAHVVQQSDGCFHMAAVFPIDQQPRAEYKDDTMSWTSCGRRL